MVIKSFEPALIYPPTVLLRGRDSYFWKRKFFQDLQPYDYHSDIDHSRVSPVQEFHFLIIFDPQRFLVVDPEGIDAILNHLSQCSPEQELIFSVEGNPFWAISHGAFQKLNLDLSRNTELMDRLKKYGKIRLIPLTEFGGFSVLEIEKNLRAVEDAVLNFQSRAFSTRGVIIEDRGHFFIEGMMPIGKGTRISPGVVIIGDSKIGEDVHIYPHCFIENSTISDHCTLLPGCIVRDSRLEENVQIGPYTHLRNDACVKQGAKMGNFVEMKKSVLGEGSKAMHLTYIGDAEVGKNVNIGAGTITCNYDGIQKHRTVIEDGVFIGSGTELVAPVAIRKNSVVGAGSTITEEVPQDALAVARQRQRNIPGWVTRKKSKKTCHP